MMAFAIHRRESAVGAHVSPHPELPFLPTSLPHPCGVSQGTNFECPASCIELALVIYFTYGNTFHAVPSNHPTLASFHGVQKSVLTSVSPLLPCM